MKREQWPLALIIGLSMVFSLGTAIAQEAEPSPEADPVQETEPAQEAEPAQEPEAAAETEESPESEAAPEAAGMDFEATVKFSQLQKASLDGSAGEIGVEAVEFEVAGAKGGGITGAFSSADTEMQAIITTRLTLKNSAGIKVKFDAMVQFLDKDGQVIDRAVNSDNFKKSERTFDIKHTTLRWAVDYIDQARITVKQKE
jgi:hypothetical protein